MKIIISRVAKAAVPVVAACSLALGSAPAASAAEPISGQVLCWNSQVSGVWIEAENGGSGFASWEMPIELGGLGKANFSYVLPNGGRYEVHVGCGGDRTNWGMSAESGWASGNANFECGDIPDWLRVAGGWAIGKGLGQIAGRIAGHALKDDVPPYGTCKQV